MTRFYAAFAVVIAIVVTGFGAQLLQADPEHNRPPHQARPVAAQLGPLPLEVVGGDSTIGAVSAWVEGTLAHELAEAERLAAARSTPSVSVVGGRTQSSGACGSDWDCFRECTIDHESRSAGDYSTNTGNGYYGAFQFAQSTWNSVAVNAGYGEWAGRPASDAPKDVQDAVARFLWEHSGTQPWGGRCG